MTPDDLRLQATHFTAIPAKFWPGGAGAGHEDEIQVYSLFIDETPASAEDKEVVLLLAGNGPTIKAHISPDSGRVTVTTGWTDPVSAPIDPDTARQVHAHYIQEPG